MIAIGIGCKRGIESASISALVHRAYALIPRATEGAILFSHERKQGEAGLIEAATQLGLALAFLPHEALEAAGPLVVTHSDHSLESTGIASIAEASALAGAGAGAHLLLPRIKGEGVTCAIAEGDGR